MENCHSMGKICTMSEGEELLESDSRSGLHVILEEGKMVGSLFLIIPLRQAARWLGVHRS
jgi:hypothetical protein